MLLTTHLQCLSETLVGTILIALLRSLETPMDSDGSDTSERRAHIEFERSECKCESTRVDSDKSDKFS